MSSGVYSVASYGSMIADRVRMKAYVRALERSVQPGAVVVDIGTGTGICALLACRLGARRVYAIEPDDAIAVARETAAANGFADRIEWIQDVSTRVALPERADVIVSDLRGCLPLYRQHLTAVADARRRFLREDGVLIPQLDTLWLTPVESPDAYREYEEPWTTNAFDLDMRPGRGLVVNTWRKARASDERWLAPAVCWATLDYRRIESPDVSAEVTCVVNQRGTGHGMRVWFEATLADGIGYSTAPNLPELVYGNAFFPWREPVSLVEGDVAVITIAADLVNDDYIWRWNTEVLEQGDPGRVKAQFRQSTFQGIPFSPAQLKKRAGTFRPTLGLDGRIVKYVLDRMADRVALQDVATELTHEFPARFARVEDALAYVGELSVKYSESPDRQPAQAG